MSRSHRQDHEPCPAPFLLSERPSSSARSRESLSLALKIKRPDMKALIARSHSLLPGNLGAGSSRAAKLCILVRTAYGHASGVSETCLWSSIQDLQSLRGYTRSRSVTPCINKHLPKMIGTLQGATSLSDRRLNGLRKAYFARLEGHWKACGLIRHHGDWTVIGKRNSH